MGKYDLLGSAGSFVWLTQDQIYFCRIEGIKIRPGGAGEAKLKPFNGHFFFFWPKTGQKISHHPGNPVHYAYGTIGNRMVPVHLASMP